jgi:FKBP-type peptidyl-prolyl cis-trans isomerase
MVSMGVIGLLTLSTVLRARQATQPSTQPTNLKTTTLGDGLKIIFVQEGGGARVGDTVWIHYEGRLENGTKFDASYDRNEPTALTLGQGQVIRGWEEGLVGMTIGEKRQLLIPPSLGFGAAGRGDKVPPNATLIFDVEMMGIRRG